ncbi:MAG: hypothetical protein J6I49_03500 [Bacteroidales bacterium]|nr:hypothetical protein [Bacteroidales bacterium]
MEQNSEEILKALIDAIKAELEKNEEENLLPPIIYMPQDEPKWIKWLEWLGIGAFSLGVFAVIMLFVLATICTFRQL